MEIIKTGIKGELREGRGRENRMRDYFAIFKERKHVSHMGAIQTLNLPSQYLLTLFVDWDNRETKLTNSSQFREPF